MTLRTDQKNFIMYDAELNGVRIPALIDTGANSSFLSSRVVDQLPVSVERSTCNEAELADGRKLKIDGCVKAELAIAGRKFSDVELEVVNIRRPLLLGEDFLVRTGAAVLPMEKKIVFPEPAWSKLTQAGVS